jgi:hypothetical protein
MKTIKIKSINKIDCTENRYDIEVKNTNCFFANNILVHNSSTTFYYNKGEFGVCGRNKKCFNKSDPKWKVALKYDLENKMKNLGKNYAIQGECIGPKIQGNIYELEEHDIRIFIVYDIDKQKELPLSDMYEICLLLGLKTVPLIETEHKLVNDIKFYVELSKGKSSINPKKLREGIVIRLADNNHKSFGFSFKSINPDYLLKQKD